MRREGREQVRGEGIVRREGRGQVKREGIVRGMGMGQVKREGIVRGMGMGQVRAEGKVRGWEGTDVSTIHTPGCYGDHILIVSSGSGVVSVTLSSVAMETTPAR